MPHAHFMPIGGKYFLMRSSVKFIVTSRWRFQRSWTRYLVCISAQLSASGTLTTVIVPSRTAWWLTSIRLRSHRLRPDGRGEEGSREFGTLPSGLLRQRLIGMNELSCWRLETC